MNNAKNSRLSDTILESLNRFHEAKLTGALDKNELSTIIISIGDLFANKIKQGTVTKNEIDSAEAFLSGFSGPNKSSYFDYDHENLDLAKKTFEEGIDFALQARADKALAAKPVEVEYSKTYKKVA